MQIFLRIVLLHNTEYYNKFDTPAAIESTNPKIYSKLFVDKPMDNGDIGRDIIYIELPDRMNDEGGRGIGIHYDRLTLLSIINTGSEPDVVSAYNKLINEFIVPYRLYYTTDDQTLNAFEYPFLITEVDRNGNYFAPNSQNTNYGRKSAQVYLKTVSTTRFFNLYLRSGQYKFGMAIVNDQFTIQTSDFNIFPYTISDFIFTPTLLQVNGEYAPISSESPTELSAFIQYVNGNTPTADTTSLLVSNINIKEIGETSIKFEFTSNETGTVFNLAKILTEPAPSVDDILNSGAINNISIGLNIILISGLIPGNNYTLYSVFRDTNNNYVSISGNRINNINFTTQSAGYFQSVLTNTSALIRENILNKSTYRVNKNVVVPSIIINGNRSAVINGITIENTNGNNKFYQDIVSAINNYNNNIRIPPLELNMSVVPF